MLNVNWKKIIQTVQHKSGLELWADNSYTNMKGQVIFEILLIRKKDKLKLETIFLIHDFRKNNFLMW